MDDKTRDEWLEERQDGRIYPLGRALRATFDAENHDSLGSDVTGLMIDLSKVPYEEDAAASSQPMSVENAARPSIMTRLTDLIARR